MRRPFAALLLGLLLAPPAAAGTAAAEPEPTGRLVSVGDHRLHIHCTGAGTPTVLLEAGLGGNHLDWVRVQPRLAETTRVCSYDRAGYGWSDPGPGPRTAGRIAAELDTLLRAAGVAGPYVLVGHSFGGVLALHFAERQAGQVVGLVLVDSMHPRQFEAFAAAGVDIPTEPSRALIGASPQLTTFGMPAEVRGLAQRLASREAARSATFSELRNMDASLAEIGEPAGGRSLPAEVLVHGRRDWDRLYPDGRMADVWLRLQSDLARRLGAQRLVRAQGSGHQVPLEAPALVAKMVRHVVEAARDGPARGPARQPSAP